MFSPTVVVLGLGPFPSPTASPNFTHPFCRAATRGLSLTLRVTYRTRRVVLTCLPSSLIRYVIDVSVPSLFWIVCGGGSSDVVCSTSSSSSAQSCLPSRLVSDYVLSKTGKKFRCTLSG